MTKSSQDLQEEKRLKVNKMELLITADSYSLVVANIGSGSKLDLNTPQQEKILAKLRKRCPTCGICSGATRVSNTGHIYETSISSVPQTCPLNGETITV